MNSDPLAWLNASGPLTTIVVSTRVRLARNLAGRPFRGRNGPLDRESVARLVEAAVAESPGLHGAAWHRLDRMPRETRRWWFERQLVSKELAALEPGARPVSGASVLAGDTAAVMVNEEDHLRIQALRSGCALAEAYAAAEAVDSELGRRVSFAFHSEFGYLTSCPTNVGTGLRASVLIHLPALVLTREIGKVLQGLAQVGLTHRGLFGEGSEVLGNLFQLSNQTTLGRTEGELLDHLGRMVREVIDYEGRARDLLMRDAPLLVEDRSWRAWGLLRHARALSFEELVNLLSGVRLGVGMGLLPAVPMAMLNRLLVTGQDAHVAEAVGTDLDDEALPAHRATLVRRRFEEEAPE
jgi:protein arginine kinase